MGTVYNFIKNRKLLYIGVLEITTEKEQDWYNLMLISDLSVLFEIKFGTHRKHGKDSISSNCKSTY